MRSKRLVMHSLCLVILLSGCTQPSDDKDLDPQALWTDTGTAVNVPCSSCWEPFVVALDDGAALVSDYGDAVFHVDAAGNVTRRAVPMPDLGASAVFTEDSLHRAGPRVWYVVNGHDGQGFDGAARPVFDNRVYLFGSDDNGTSWPVQHVFVPGASQPHTLGALDRIWVRQGGDTVALTWNQPSEGRVEYVVSTDGGATFGPIATLPRTAMFSDLVPRPAVSADGTIVVPTTNGFGGVAVNAPTVGALGAMVSDDGGRSWTTNMITLEPDQVPHNQVFFTGTAWSEEVGFLFVWRSASGTLWGAVSPDGHTWGAPQVLDEEPRQARQPWLETRDGTAAATTFATEGDSRQLMVTTWDVRNGTSKTRIAATDIGDPGEVAGHDIPPSGGTLFVVPTDSGYMLGLAPPTGSP